MIALHQIHQFLMNNKSPYCPNFWNSFEPICKHTEPISWHMGLEGALILVTRKDGIKQMAKHGSSSFSTNTHTQPIFLQHSIDNRFFLFSQFTELLIFNPNFPSRHLGHHQRFLILKLRRQRRLWCLPPWPQCRQNLFPSHHWGCSILFKTDYKNRERICIPSG